MKEKQLNLFRKDYLTAIVCVTFWMIVTAFFVGLRLEHLLMGGLLLGMFFASEASRKLLVGLLPFVLFAVSYDWMRVYPNYMVNPIDIADIYHAEKALFGIGTGVDRLIPCEYYAIHNSSIMDFFAGIFYLTWVPVPVAFALYLYYKKERALALRFSMVFLFVNLIGFAGYYIHPAAPPWYVMNYGFEPIMDTPGNAAALARFDELTGIPIFDALYGRNSNIFAAVPSLHSAYLVVVLFYAFVRRSHPAALLGITICLFGIWFTAVYSAHHYIIDVILGALCSLLGILIFEYVLLRIGKFKSFFDKYCQYIKA